MKKLNNALTCIWIAMALTTSATNEALSEGGWCRGLEPEAPRVAYHFGPFPFRACDEGDLLEHASIFAEGSECVRIFMGVYDFPQSDICEVALKKKVPVVHDRAVHYCPENMPLSGPNGPPEIANVTFDVSQTEIGDHKAYIIAALMSRDGMISSGDVMVQFPRLVKKDDSLSLCDNVLSTVADMLYDVVSQGYR